MGPEPVPDLAARLRLIVLTDVALAAPRGIVEVVSAALEAGAPSIQLRLKGAPTRELVAVGRELRARTRAHGALLWINDRADVAEAVEADGVHVGPGDPPVKEIRRVWGEALRIGTSTDDPDTARRHQDAGADYIGCGAVFGTTTKDVGGEAISAAGLARVARAVRIPVIGIGGITPARVARLRGSGAAGVAVVGAVMAADDPGAVVRELLNTPLGDAT